MKLLKTIRSHLVELLLLKSQGQLHSQHCIINHVLVKYTETVLVTVVTEMFTQGHMVVKVPQCCSSNEKYSEFVWNFVYITHYLFLL